MKNLTKVDHSLRQHEEEYAAFATLNAAPQETGLFERKMCVHQLFEAQVAQTPEAPALVVKGATLSYAELNRQANRLAHRLQLLGVGPEVLVGLCLPRTADLPIALLAILKAGGAYVPLDPAYPPDRLRFQIHDSGAPLLLTTSALEHLWQGIEVTRLYLDQIGNEDHATPSSWDANLERQSHEDHLAYVIYTSGSTGRPKGVCIAHRNTMALVRWSLRHFTLEDVRGMVAGTSICFDLSIFELFVPWSCGGTVYLVENGLHLPEGDAREKATLLNMVPSVMAELARTTTIPASIRVITFCGETLPRPLVERLYHLPGVQRIYNLYGPTEDTTYSTWSLLDRDEHSENVPIGYPLDGSQVYLLDQDGYEVPNGTIGEIYLGGAGVTRGYWNRPDMTAQRFVPDPFGQQCGARLYRTGDLARYRADGQLEFLGRADQQVKIRGYRIELGEIESVLRQHSKVQECVVLARKPEAGGTYLILVAYVVPTEPQKNLEDELLVFLQQRLPEYMLPTFFVSLEALPKTSNGKIDRQALPAPQAGKERKQPRASQTKFSGALNLSAGKKELFKKLQKKEYAPPSAPSFSETGKELLSPEPDKERELFPLSFTQQRYWLIDQLDPGTPLYNIFFASRATGNLNVKALMRTLHEIVRRHEPLRTAFLKVDGTPMQRICPPSNFPVPIIDLRSLSPEQQQQEEERLLQQEPLASIDIRQGHLLRTHLIQVTDTVFILMVNIHHVACDGLSIDIFREELGALYEAFSQGRPSPLPNLPIRYVDYALWQQRRLQGSLLEQQLSYWRHQLANLPGPLHLPTDRPRSARQTFNGGNYRFPLPPSLYQALQELGQNEGVTLFMTLFAAFQILLCRLSGQEDVLVGTPIANRRQADFEKLIGCFVNTVVFRTSMEGNPSFRSFLQRMRTMAIGAYNHQDISFEQVLHVVRPERDSAYAYSPLFQVMFHFDNIVIKTRRDVDLDVEGLIQKNMAAKFDLSLRMRIQETDDTLALEGVFFYNSDLFDETTIIRFAQRLHCLLESAVAHPDRSIWQLALLPEQERELLEEWNNTHLMASSEQGTCIHQLFEAQAARTPEAIALVAQGEVLSYAQLNHKANQLAHHLQLIDVGPEVLVGLCLPYTSDLLIALLAVLKAGGAYLPLDPTASSEQLASTLKDTQVAVLITRQAQIAGKYHGQVIDLDREQAVIAQRSTENPVTAIKGENAAYVLHTSSRAEAPRATIIEHRQLLNYIHAISQRTGMTQGSSFALVQPLTADSSVTAIYAPLCTGGTLHMISPEYAFDANMLSDYFQRYAIDYLSIAPSHLAALHSSPRGRQVMPRQCLMVDGETTAWEWLRKLKAEHPACTIFHHYGATEATVGATTYLVEQEQDGRSHTSTPIGRPLANVQIHILDHALEPVPIYTPGELYIGGSNVARGYLHDPALTAEKFIADPFSTLPGAHLYKTGDLARYLPNGDIELLGRIDDQIKVRGIRIELGEVQAALSRHPAVHFAIVLAGEDTPGDRQLIAYVVLRDGQSVTASDLRRHASQYLRSYMVPSAFVLLDVLPMTAHGSIDYKKLPAPDSFRKHTKAHIAPQSEIELKLVRIWEDLLHISPISVNDNFFDLGGNSLVAVRLMAQIQREFQQDLPISVLFQKTTPEQLATELLRRRWSSAHAALVEIQPAGTKLPFFCVHPIGGEVFCYAELAHQLGPDQPFYGLQVPKQSQQQVSAQTIEEMAHSYIAAMQSVQPGGPYLLGGWSLGGVIAFEMAQQLVQQGHQVALLALFESYPPVRRQSDKTLIQLFCEDLEGVFSRRLYVDPAQLHDLSPDEQLIRVYIQARQEDIVPPDLELEHFQRMLSVYQRNIEAVQRYQPSLYPGELTLFTTRTFNGNKQIDRSHEWQALTNQEPDVHIIPGNHYSILKKPDLYHLVEVLKDCLDKIG